MLSAAEAYLTLAAEPARIRGAAQAVGWAFTAVGLIADSSKQQCGDTDPLVYNRNVGGASMGEVMKEIDARPYDWVALQEVPSSQISQYSRALSSRHFQVAYRGGGGLVELVAVRTPRFHLVGSAVTAGWHLGKDPNNFGYVIVHVKDARTGAMLVFGSVHLPTPSPIGSTALQSSATSALANAWRSAMRGTAGGVMAGDFNGAVHGVAQRLGVNNAAHVREASQLVLPSVPPLVHMIPIDGFIVTGKMHFVGSGGCYGACLINPVGNWAGGDHPGTYQNTAY